MNASLTRLATAGSFASFSVSRSTLSRRTIAPLLARRPASGKSDGGASKHTVLEKPDRFRPPSHPQRLRGRGGAAAPVRNYGPDLTADERAAQKTRRYPNMMPPEGSWMHWILSNKQIHFWFTMTVLTVTGVVALVLSIKNGSPFADMLPSSRQWLWHPLDSAYQLVQVMKISSEHTSRITAEKRQRELEEVRKRKAYRLAHGLEGMDGIDEADPIFAAAMASRLERETKEKERLELEERLARGEEPASAAGVAGAAGSATANATTATKSRKWFW